MKMKTYKISDHLLCFNYKESPPYHQNYRCIDMLRHINEGENELETIAFTSVFFFNRMF